MEINAKPQVIHLTVIEENDLAPLEYTQYCHSVIAPSMQDDLGMQVCLSDELITTLKTCNTKIQLVAFSPLLNEAVAPGRDELF